MRSRPTPLDRHGLTNPLGYGTPHVGDTRNLNDVARIRDAHECPLYSVESCAHDRGNTDAALICQRQRQS